MAVSLSSISPTSRSSAAASEAAMSALTRAIRVVEAESVQDGDFEQTLDVGDGGEALEVVGAL
jgi:hypothetical protein